MEVALGLRPHSGWAVAVVVTPPPAPQLVWRARVAVLGPGDPKQPWHTARDRALGPEAADALVAGVAAGARGAAEAVVAEAIAHGAATVGIVGVPRDLPPTPAILANHSLLHAAEGELYRLVLAEASEDAGLPVVSVAPRDLDVDLDEHADVLAAMRREHGPPWQADHRLATVAAWTALAVARTR